MSLIDAMLEQLAAARRILADGGEIVPSWLITTPEGSYLILTDFDPDNPGAGKRVLFLVSRFMMWKLAISFVLTAETLTSSPSPRAAERRSLWSVSLGTSA